MKKRRNIKKEIELYPGMEDAGIGVPVPDGTGPEPYEEDLYDRSFSEGFEHSSYYGESGDDDLYEDDDLLALLEEEDADDTYPSGGGQPGLRNTRGPYLFISIAFSLIFLLLIGHLVYFNLRMKDRILNSPYNKRQSAQANLVRRGSIVSIDGVTLARTETDDEGNETRVYPYANEYAHVVGFLTHGKSGLESIANYQLLTSHTNIIDQVINEFLKRKNPGDNVITTLNAGLQDAAYYALGDYRGAIVILDPQTGAIKAMVSQPAFDPNTLAYVWDDMVADPTNSQLVNRATQGLYAPGSTFKIITALAYYRTHHTFDGFEYDCTGEFEIEDSVVHCYKGAIHGLEDFTSAFAHSCNTAFSQIGLDLGISRLSSTAEKMMFGESMPTELPSSRSRWSLNSSSDDVELVQTAFGQGKTLVTPFHMALITSAIANKGVIMKPYLIDHVENVSGDVISRTKTSAYKTLLSGTEAEELTKLMEAVVNGGSASELSGRSYRVAGKTGSAEYVRSDGTIGTHSWFVGFTNPEDPDLVIAVIAENGGAGSTTAVPIASRIFSAYYGE